LRRTVRPSLLRRLAWRLRDAAFLTADSLALAFGPRRAAPGGNETVAIMAAHGIGDLVLLLPTFDALCARFAGSRSAVTLICSITAEEFARRHLDVGALIAIDRVRLRRDLRYRLGLLREVESRRFSAIVQASFNRDLLIEDALVRASRAHLRIGSAGTPMFMPPLARHIGDRWYSRLVPASPGTLHELERNVEFLRALASNAPAPAPSRPLSVTRRPAGPAYALFVISSSSPLKTWPLAHFEQVARALSAATGFRAEFCAAPDDDVPQYPAPFGRTSLPELIASIGGARLVVCNDSAASHLAAALGVPCVAVVGGGIIGRYHPYPHHQEPAPVPVGLAQPMPCFDCGWRCRYRLAPGEAAPCVEGIEPERVLAAALGLLQFPARSGTDASTSA
jgi:ADP-heptose:LPS heptosyltransferase